MTPRQPFSAVLIEENTEKAETIIVKWDIEASKDFKLASLFSGDRKEVMEFLNSVKELQSAMHFFVLENSSSEQIVLAQKLMQIAIKRLQKEFYEILSANRKFLDSESVSSRASTISVVSDFEDNASEDEVQLSSDPISEAERVSELTMRDLKAIADCMISSGYGKECVKIYNINRKSIVDESLYNLGFEKLSWSKIQKMDWDVIEVKIKNWLNAVKIAVTTLFYGERILCDHVFSVSEKIRESCFAEISRETALTLFEFPELIAKCKKTPEKIFRTLDLYDSVSELLPEIESIFSFESTSAVRSQAVNSLLKLGDAVRSMLSEFETAIEKDSSKSPAPGGGVHPLTRYVMNYAVFLSDYSGALSEIVADLPMTVQSPLPESYFSSPKHNGSLTSVISERLAWVILVLLCKLDGKAQLYKDVSLAYLFLANNLNYVVSKVRHSNLKLLMGDDWLLNHEMKVTLYASNYERVGWSKVTSSMPENPTADISPEEVKDCFKRFNSGFEEAYRKQTSWVILDPKLRDEVKVSVARKLVPAYRGFYEKYRGLFLFQMEHRVGDSLVRFAPEDLENYVSDLFHGTRGVSGSTSSYSSSSPSRDDRLSRRGLTRLRHYQAFCL